MPEWLFSLRLLVTQTSVCLIQLHVTKERSCLLWWRWGLQEALPFSLHASCQTTCELQRQEQHCNSLAVCYISHSGAPIRNWWMPSDDLPESRKQVKEYRFLKILVKDELNYSKGGKSILNHLIKANDDLSKHPHVTNDYEWYCIVGVWLHPLPVLALSCSILFPVYSSNTPAS